MNGEVRRLTDECLQRMTASPQLVVTKATIDSDVLNRFLLSRPHPPPLPIATSNSPHVRLTSLVKRSLHTPHMSIGSPARPENRPEALVVSYRLDQLYQSDTESVMDVMEDYRPPHLLREVSSSEQQVALKDNPRPRSAHASTAHRPKQEVLTRRPLSSGSLSNKQKKPVIVLESLKESMLPLSKPGLPKCKVTPCTAASPSVSSCDSPISDDGPSTSRPGPASVRQSTVLTSHKGPSSSHKGPPNILKGPPNTGSNAPIIIPLPLETHTQQAGYVSNELDGLDGWFDCEEHVQTATVKKDSEAREPLEHGQHELISHSQQPVIPQTVDDVASQTPSVILPFVMVTDEGGNIHLPQPGGQNEGTETVKKKRGRPRKTDNTPKPAELDEHGNPVKRKRGRPAKPKAECPSSPGKKRRKNLLSMPGSRRGKKSEPQITIKEEPSDLASPPAESVPAATKRKRKKEGDEKEKEPETEKETKKDTNEGKEVTKEDKKEGKEKTKKDKKESKEVTKKQSKEKGDKKEEKKKRAKKAAESITKAFQRPHPLPSMSNQTEDSGYSTYISGSDSSSRSSNVSNSHSPMDSVLSPELIDYPQTFDGMLTQDPVMLGTNIPELHQDIVVKVIESGQGDGIIQTPEAVQEVVLNEDGKVSMEPTDAELIYQLDALLSDEQTQIFSPDELAIAGTQEVTTYEDEEAILNSDTVTDCLKELQQSGRITGASHLITPGPASEKGQSGDPAKGLKRKRLVRKKTSSAAKKKTLSMFSSRTKSGRRSKPSARMIDSVYSVTSPDSALSPKSPDTLSPPAIAEQSSPTLSTSAADNISAVSSSEGGSSPEINIVDSDNSSTKTPLTVKSLPPSVCCSPSASRPGTPYLKDFSLHIERSPVASPMMQKLSVFSFRHPDLSTPPIERTVTIVSPPAKEEYKRIVTIEATPPRASSSSPPLRGLEFENSTEPPSDEAAPSSQDSENSQTASVNRAAVTKEKDKAKKFASPNTLSMSLDVILKGMDNAKGTPKHVKSADIFTATSLPGLDRVVMVTPLSETPTLPVFERLHPNAHRHRMVHFQDDSSSQEDFDLVSLQADSSLDQVLQGESLFGGRPESEGGVESVDTSDEDSQSTDVLEHVTTALRHVTDHMTSRFDHVTSSPGHVTEPLHTSPVSSPSSSTSNADTFSFKMPELPHSYEDEEAGSESETTLPIERKVKVSNEGGDEDIVDLFADDSDLFDSDANDTPLANFGKPASRHSLSPLSESAVAPPFKKPIRSRLGFPHPPNQGSKAPGYSNSPQAVRYKKTQVSQWVANQQSRLHPLSHSVAHHHMSNHPVPVPWGLNWNANSSNEGLNVGESPLPPPTAPPAPHTYGQSSTQGYGSFQRRVGYHCVTYLIRGHCDYPRCRLKHEKISTAPLHIVEAALFEGPPLDFLPLELLMRYTSDVTSPSHLQQNMDQFENLVQGLNNKNFTTFSKAFLYFNHTVKFNQPFLTRCMELCSQQPPSPGNVQPLTIASNIYISLSKREPVVRDLCYLYLKTLSNFDSHSQMPEVYDAMRSQGKVPNYDIMLIMLRVGRQLEHRVLFDLLDDLKHCSPPLADIEAARYVNRLLDICDHALLLKHASRLSSWVELTPVGVLNKVTVATFKKLFPVFFQERLWSALVTMFSSCPQSCLADIEGTKIAEVFNFAVSSLGVSEKMVDILSVLSEDKMTGISSQVWNGVIGDTVKQSKVHRVRKFYHIATSHNKALTVETYSAVMSLFLAQGDHSDAVAVLKVSLGTHPSAPPPSNMLTAICEVMTSADDILLVITSLLQSSIAPPPSVLQCLLNANTRSPYSKVYQSLVDVVRHSLAQNVILDKLFYQKVLVELRQWGRDQDGISCVYKALRRVEQLDGVGEGFQGGSGEFPVEALPELSTTDKPSTPLVKTLSFKPPSLPVKPVPTSPVGVISPLGRTSGSMSLENVLQQSSSDHNSLLDLIEVNGSQGQFGAVSSILVTLPGATTHYNKQAVHSVWKAITKSKLRSANAFESFLSCLAQSRNHGNSSDPKSSLHQSDRWLISQVGIALLKLCEVQEDWQSGFVVLHYLHRYGIHYVKLSQPSADLPPCSTGALSPCRVALMAINVCMHIDQVSGALEVMVGCDWIQPSSTVELGLRTRLLVQMVEKFLNLNETENAWKCLQGINSCTVIKAYLHVVTNLHNKLLQSLLAAKELETALTVYRTMRAGKLQCLPSYFSCLLDSLSNSGQDSLARALCKAAIISGCYCSLTRGDPFRVTLPVGLVRVELYLLLEDHLNELAEGEGDLKEVTVNFSPGSRSTLEQVFAVDFTPSLTVTFSLHGNSLSIPVSSLSEWATLHSSHTYDFTSTTEQSHYLEAVSIGDESLSHDQSIQSCDTEGDAMSLDQSCDDDDTILVSPMTDKSTENQFPAEQRSDSTATVTGEDKSHDQPVIPCDSAIEHKTMSHDQPVVSCDSRVKAEVVSRDPLVVTSRTTQTPPPAVTAKQRPVELEAEGERVKVKKRLRLKRSRSEGDALPGEVESPPTKKMKRKEARQTVCDIVVDQLKPYYQSGRFKSHEDYTHFIAVLSRKYFKTFKRDTNPPSKDIIHADISHTILTLMPQIQTYSSKMDSILGLSESPSN